MNTGTSDGQINGSSGRLVGQINASSGNLTGSFNLGIRAASYIDLANKPKINGTVLIGDVSLTELGIFQTISFEEENWVYEFSLNKYQLTITLEQQNIGINASVVIIERYNEDSATYMNVDFQYERRVNGNIVISVDEPFKGNAQLKG